MKTGATKIKTLFLLFVLAGCAAGAPRALQQEAGAQRKPAAAEPAKLFANIEQVFCEKEPGWKIESLRVDPESDTQKQSIVLRSDEGQAAVEVWVWKKEQDARDVFAAHAKAFDNTRGGRMVKDKLQGLGDENYICTNRGSEAWPTIQFRQGRANVTVFAPSVTVANRFARRVLEQLNAE